MSLVSSIALIGFGEVGQALATSLAGRASLSAWDVAFGDPHSRPSCALAAHQVRAGASAAAAIRGAQLVISAVTAAQTLEAAREAAGQLEPGAYFLDLNSASPAKKREAADVVQRAGGRYVEAAVMSPILPRRIASPMLLGGSHATSFLDVAAALGFACARVYSSEVGRAAATKLCRSVVVKGLEALLAEALLAARRHGVEGEVLGSLSNVLPLADWNVTAWYMIGRALKHGTRRAEEMREAASTVEEAGVEPLMSRAIAERQDWCGERRGAGLAPDLAGLLDAMAQHGLRGVSP